MARKQRPWVELESGVWVLKLYETELNREGPRIVILHLAPDKFREFESDPLGFANRRHLYPGHGISWISSCIRPPQGRGIPRVLDESWWTAIIVKGKRTMAACAAAPHETT